MATKGLNDLHYAFTNSECLWEETLYTDLPWEIPPALTLSIGFSIKMLQVDLLHVWNLGVGRDMVGSVVSVLVRRRDVWHGDTIDKRLKVATRDLAEFAKRHRYTLSRKRLTKQSLCLKSGCYPELHASGHDTVVIAKFLTEVVESKDLSDIPEVCTLVWAANSCFSVLAEAGHFLEQCEKEHLRVVGHLFCKTYLKLAWGSLQEGKRLWRMRPTWHLLQHVFRCQYLSGVNPRWYATWIDEDSLKKFMRVNRLTHRSTAAVRVLQRWLLSVPATFAELAG